MVRYLCKSCAHIGRQAAQWHTWFTNIGHRTLPKMFEVRFLYGAYIPGEWFWIDSNVKNGNHLAEGSFGSEFPAICNHCWVMVAWSGKTFKLCEEFLRFFLEKMILYGNIFKILFWQFSSRHRLTLLCSNVVKFVGREISEIVHVCKLSLRCGSRPKSASASPQQCTIRYYTVA